MNHPAPWQPWLRLVDAFDLVQDSVQYAPFQGEICSVFQANSPHFGPLVIKTAYRDGKLNPGAQEEIAANKAGYECIAPTFRPELLLVDDQDTILVMPNVGEPLRDVLWHHQSSLPASEDILDQFTNNLLRLFTETRANDAQAKQAYLQQLQEMGTFFLRQTFFPKTLRESFPRFIKQLADHADDTVALATLDMTQGNLLIDTSVAPQTLMIIDSKKPRLVRGAPTFLGIPEVDLGMFVATLGLNAPPTVTSLSVEKRLKEVGHAIRDDHSFSDFAFDVGRLFGYILIASFPNSAERTKRYLQAVSQSEHPILHVNERAAYGKKAVGLAVKLSERELS
jgi:hypothetical protein